MKKILIITILAMTVVVPFSDAQASIFDDLYGAVKVLQKQVVNMVSTKIDLVKPTPIKAVAPEVWKNYASSTLGYEVQYPRDFGTTSIFLVAPDYKNADAFVRISREDFLKKILKPGSISFDLAVQDSVIFFLPAKSDDMYANPNKYLGKVSTSTKQIGSTTVEYILYSEKTDPNKFGGGSVEKVIFTNGSTTIMAEASFSADTPTGPTKVVFDKMLTTFKFITASSSHSSLITASSTLGILATSTEVISTSSTTAQTAGALFAQ